VYVNRQDTSPIYIQIADSIRNKILAGTLSNGNKLPSIRKLASELACNPNTIQRAYRELEAEGWITAVSGKGYFVCAQQQEMSMGLASIWTDLDSACKKLLRAGMPLQTLIKHLKQNREP